MKGSGRVYLEDLPSSLPLALMMIYVYPYCLFAYCTSKCKILLGKETRRVVALLRKISQERPI